MLSKINKKSYNKEIIEMKFYMYSHIVYNGNFLKVIINIFSNEIDGTRYI